MVQGPGQYTGATCTGAMYMGATYMGVKYMGVKYMAAEPQPETTCLYSNHTCT